MKIKKKKEKIEEKSGKERMLREKIEKEVKVAKIKEESEIEWKKGRRKVILLVVVLVGLITVMVLLFLNRTIALSFASFFIVVGLFFLYLYFHGKLKEAARVKKIEAAFPDFLQLMASNLRAGMTIDRAMLLSSRPEFDPLDKEILNVGKDIATGKNVETALLDMSKRVKSKKIEKTILLIISGIKAGGNLAVLLEETASNMRKRDFVEKRAASNVLMYVIFIFVAAAIGAPVLFSLSSVLVETLVNLLSGMTTVEATSFPFTLSSVNISSGFIKYFSLVFIIVTNILASLVLGLVNKGEEREGIKYIIPMLAISITIFFVIRIVMSRTVVGMFG